LIALTVCAIPPFLIAAKWHGILIKPKGGF